MSPAPRVPSTAPPTEEDRARQRHFEDQDVLEVLALPSGAGRRFLLRLLDQCALYDGTFHQNAWQAFRAGERNIGLWLVHALQRADRRAYAQLLLEHADDLEVRAAEGDPPVAAAAGGRRPPPSQA